MYICLCVCHTLGSSGEGGSMSTAATADFFARDYFAGSPLRAWHERLPVAVPRVWQVFVNVCVCVSVCVCVCVCMRVCVCVCVCASMCKQFCL